jgi:hypothetical protein
MTAGDAPFRRFSGVTSGARFHRVDLLEQLVELLGFLVACARACHATDDLVNDVLERQLVKRAADPLTHHLPVPSSSSLRHADTVACYADVADIPAYSSS